ncbi:unnamed protein product [Ectocarpus sp. CCAP 1310/34]|nr:unnamed protein product [Ectocarpus sp. CCAP 1310/34]
MSKQALTTERWPKPRKQGVEWASSLTQHAACPPAQPRPSVIHLHRNLIAETQETARAFETLTSHDQCSKFRSWLDSNREAVAQLDHDLPDTTGTSPPPPTIPSTPRSAEPPARTRRGPRRSQSGVVDGGEEGAAGLHQPPAAGGGGAMRGHQPWGGGAVEGGTTNVTEGARGGQAASPRFRFRSQADVGGGAGNDSGGAPLGTGGRGAGGVSFALDMDQSP